MYSAAQAGIAQPLEGETSGPMLRQAPIMIGGTGAPRASLRSILGARYARWNLCTTKARAGEAARKEYSVRFINGGPEGPPYKDLEGCALASGLKRPKLHDDVFCGYEVGDFGLVDEVCFVVG